MKIENNEEALKKFEKFAENMNKSSISYVAAHTSIQHYTVADSEIWFPRYSCSLTIRGTDPEAILADLQTLVGAAAELGLGLHPESIIKKYSLLYLAVSFAPSSLPIPTHDWVDQLRPHLLQVAAKEAKKIEEDLFTPVSDYVFDRGGTPYKSIENILEEYVNVTSFTPAQHDAFYSVLESAKTGVTVKKGLMPPKWEDNCTEFTVDAIHLLIAFAEDWDAAENFNNGTIE